MSSYFDSKFKAIKSLQENFNDYQFSQNIQQKEEARIRYVGALNVLNECLKSESNPAIRAQLELQMPVYIGNAKAMKQEMEAYKQNLSCQQGQQYIQQIQYQVPQAQQQPPQAQYQPPQGNCQPQGNQQNNFSAPLPPPQPQPNLPQNNLNPIQKNQNDVNQSKKNVEQSNIRQVIDNTGKVQKPDDALKLEGALAGAIITEKPNVKWDDVVGLELAKQALHEAVIMPIKFPNFFTGNRAPWRGILMYGPPGTGKTFLAKACASECKATYFSVSSSDLMSKFVGESEKLIKTLFKMARESKPSIIFLDEIDSIAGNRSEGDNDSTKRVKTEFLVQMQGVGNNQDGVLVLGATNLPWSLDPAIRRRFEKRVYIPLPEPQARRGILKRLLDSLPNSLQDDEIDELVANTDGYSGADMSVFFREASMEPLRKCQKAKWFKIDTNGKWSMCGQGDPLGQAKTLMELDESSLNLPDLSYEDFYSALTRSKPTVCEKDIVEHQKFTEQFGVGE